jgi:hypothetical protein
MSPKLSITAQKMSQASSGPAGSWDEGVDMGTLARGVMF